MKRFFFVLLIVVLVLVSCDTGKSNKGIVSIRFEIESTRAMNVTGSSIDPSEAVWTYRLIKEDGGFGYGEKKERVITGLKRISKSGLRVYAKSNEIPRVLNGLGIAIISTSKGLMTDKEARNAGLGGEVLAYIW